MSTNICEVVITADEPEWLVAFSRSLVEDRLCACAQHFGTVRSVYRWEGRVHDEPEARVALHTRSEHVPEIVERAVAAHPYEVPGVLVLPVAGGNPAYLQWVLDETALGVGVVATQAEPGTGSIEPAATGETGDVSDRSNG